MFLSSAFFQVFKGPFPLKRGTGFFYVGRRSFLVVYYDPTERCFLMGRSLLCGKSRAMRWMMGPLCNLTSALFVLLLVTSCGEYSSPSHTEKSSQEDILSTPPSPELIELLSQSDIVVLGLIDACWVCQFGPEPHVAYTKILSGKTKEDSEEASLPIASIPRRFLFPGGGPIYGSRKEEIVFLKKVVGLRFEGDVTRYEVIDIWEATPKNLSMFRGL